MTTFESFSAETRPSTGRRLQAWLAFAAGRIALRYQAWKNRRSVARLLEWDDHMLGDIGLTQGDVYSALAATADEDASVQLSMRSLERRFAREAQLRDRLNRSAELRARRRA